MLGWLLVSNKGHQLIINWSTGDNLKIGSFSGSLWSEIQLKNVEYTDKQQQLSIQQLQLHWQPKALFGRLLHIEKLLASDITYIVMDQSGKQKTFSLPA